MNKKSTFIIALLLVLIIGIFTVYVKNKNEKEEQRQLAIAEAYTRINRVLYVHSDCYTLFNPNTYTDDNINNAIYLDLTFYEKQTGVILTYEELREYFSQEYEEDGSLRLYDNGLHLEIEAYVDWAIENSEERLAYQDEINRLWGVYFREHRDEGFETTPLHYWSIETLDELIKKEADPEYEMNLLSIQQRERAEAEANEQATV
jgi:hypothetical protein